MTRRTAFIEGWSWFKFNNLGLALVTNLKFYTSVAKRLKLKVRKFGKLNSTFVEVTGEKLVGEASHPSPPILNRINVSKSTIVFRIALSKLIDNHRKVENSTLSLHYFKKNLKTIREISKEDASEFK